jgi:hypothetical protein
MQPGPPSDDRDMDYDEEGGKKELKARAKNDVEITVIRVSSRTIEKVEDTSH